jgi:hypothetical protein
MARTLIAPDPPPEGWLPAWACSDQGTFVVDWCYFGSRPLREPFFEDSLQLAMRRPVNHFLRYRTSVEALARRYAVSPGLRPTGFVFHTSRCGSTLVAQMLGAMHGSVVLSEAPPIDAVLAADAQHASVDGDQRATWLIGMLSALGQPRAPGDCHLFVKFDAWHALHLPLIRRAFPDVPWVFLYRDPREVLASQLRQPGAFLIPGVIKGAAHATGQPPSGSTVAQRVATMMQRLGDAALAALSGGRGLLLNYAQLPGAVLHQIADHFGIELTADDRAAMSNVTQFDAKTPSLTYERREEPMLALADSDRTTLDVSAMRTYLELERVRVAGGP